MVKNAPLSPVSKEQMKEYADKSMSLMYFFFPRTHPIPWDKFILLSFAIFIPAVIYLVFFTKIGVGLDTFHGVAKALETDSSVFALVLVIIMFVFILLDFPYWDSPTGLFFRRVIWVGFTICFILLVLAESVQYPYGPISLFTVVIPIWLIMLRNVFYPDTYALVFIQWLSFPFLLNSILFLVGWICWVARDKDGTHTWNDLNRLKDSLDVGCEPNFSERPDCRDYPEVNNVCFRVVGQVILYPSGCDTSCSESGSEVYTSCLSPFIIWSGPLLVSITYFFFSFFCSFFRIHKKGDITEEGFKEIAKVSEDAGGEISEKELMNFAKLWGVLIFVLWIAASYAGVGAGLTTAIGALTLAGFVGSMAFLSIVLSKAEQKQQVQNMIDAFMEKYGSYLDVVRGAFVALCTPLVFIYLAISVLVQFVRRCCCCPGSKLLGRRNSEESEEEIEIRQQDWVTEEARDRIRSFQSWDRAKVYTWAVYWGILYLVLQVIMTKLTYLFFSWLMDATSDWSLFAVTAIMIVVGMSLFLLPPIPGAPIYIAMGVVVIANGEKTFGDSTGGLIAAMAYGMFVSLIIKLLACTCQQKLIGENLSKSVSTRQMVGINSDLVKAMRLVLREPGLNMAKVGILVGGPDWPTSVLCGIMRLNLLPILVGTLPIIFLIIPTFLTGSFTYMSGLKTPSDAEIEDTTLTEVQQTQKYAWAGTTTTVVLAIAAVVQSASGLIAVYYIEQIIATRKDEIDAIPVDEEVLEADTKAALSAAAYSEVTQWEIVPFLPRFILTLAVALMIFCCYAVALFSSQCFRPFEITSSIETDLNGDWKNLFKPLGGAVMVLFIISWGLLTVFQQWGGSKANQLLEIPQEEERLRKSLEEEAQEQEQHVNHKNVSEEKEEN